MIARPSGARAAPRMKSICPPTPEYMRYPIESATTWPERSTSIAELIAVIDRNERITWVSLVKSTARISTIGLSSTKSYSLRVPIMNAATSLPRLRAFWLAGDDAGLDEVDDGVREHLGVDAEVVLAVEELGRRGRDRADAQLERRAVRHEVGDERADPPLDVADARGGRARTIGSSTSIARSIWLTWMNDSPSVRGIAALNWTMTVFAAPIAACMASTDVPSEQNPWASGGVALTKHRVERQRAGPEQRRHVRQEHRHEVRATLVDGPARVRPDEQRPVAEVRRHLGREVRPGALRVEVDHRDVLELRRPGDERVEQDLGRGRRRTGRRSGRADRIPATASSGLTIRMARV